MSTSNKILFVLSSHGTFLDGKHPTGWYLQEAAHPYIAVTKAGFEVDFASPAGGKAPLDPSSVAAAKDDKEALEFLEAPVTKHAVENTLKLSEIRDSDYAALFYVGGHGPVFDLAKDATSIALAEKFFASGRPIAAVCHGPAAFHGVKGPDGKSIFAGRRATSFSNDEETQAGLVDAIPFLVESDIIALGGTFVKERAAWGAEVVVDNSRDGTLITGGNPASATGTGEAIVEAIRAIKA